MRNSIHSILKLLLLGINSSLSKETAVYFQNKVQFIIEKCIFLAICAVQSADLHLILEYAAVQSTELHLLLDLAAVQEVELLSL